MIRIVALAMILLWVEDAQGGTVYSSTYNNPCLNECAHHGYRYAWCNTRKGWDYCSMYRGFTARGRVCKTACGTVGTYYHWCYDVRGNSNWGYCSIYDDDDDETIYDDKGHYCLQPCQETDDNRSYKCLTAFGLGDCTPISG